MFDPSAVIRHISHTRHVRRIRQWFARKAQLVAPTDVMRAVSAWAGDRSLSYDGPTPARRYRVGGYFSGYSWTIERRVGSRPFISGDELSGRVVLDLPVSPVVIVISRALKESLEKQAYEIYTDSVQTLAEPSLSEEMRWIALYPEWRQASNSQNFQQRFSVLAAENSDAEKWITSELAERVMTCAAARFDCPFILMLLRGKVYLQLELDTTFDEVAALAQSVDILSFASEAARRQFAKPTTLPSA